VTQVGKAWECVDLGEWVAPWGRETSGEYVRGRKAASRISGQTLKWGPSLRKVTSPGQGECLWLEDREVDQTTRRER